MVGLSNPWAVGIFGLFVVAAYAALSSLVFHWLFARFKPREYANMNFIQYALMHVFLISMMALPVKILLRLAFRIKYVWITPWFNV